MKVVVIDDDPNVAEVISVCCNMCWPNSILIPSVEGAKGISLAEAENPDVIILDVELPDMSGFEVCRNIRTFSDIPIIMLDDKHVDDNASRGLQMGADDYVAKPFSHIELLSRIQAVIRRTNKLPLKRDDGIPYSSNLWIDLNSREVRVNDEAVNLTPYEYNLLDYFVHNVGRVLTHQALLSKVWGQGYEHETYLLKVHIANLRRKLGDSPKNPKMIVNKRGVGYMFMRADYRRGAKLRK